VLALVLLPALASLLGTTDSALTSDPVSTWFGFGLTGVLILTFIKVAVFLGLMLLVGRRVIPWMLHYIAHTGSRELFRLAVLAIALTVAFGAAKLFGVSLALGAFFAGMILNESPLSQRAAQETLPLRDAFAVLFFVSVGMLFDPYIVTRAPGPLLATLFIILVGKSFAAYLIVLAFRHPVGTALTISASLAQIGEFSFILAGLGVTLKLLPPEGRDLILAGAILSIMLNPVIFAFVDWLIERQTRSLAPVDPEAAAIQPPVEPVKLGSVELKPTALAGHTILVGGGRVGSLVCDALKRSEQPFLVIEVADNDLARLRDNKVETISGNAARSDVLKAANLSGAKYLVVAIPEAFEAGQIVRQGRAANPKIQIIARAHSDAEVEHLSGLGADLVIMGERQIAHGIIEDLQARQAKATHPPANA
jgi:CPA2 family monovalent cation:H+ antiporter-2